MLWSEFVFGGESGLLSDSKSRIERLWLHGSYSCSLSLRYYRSSTYINTPRATARPPCQYRESCTDRLPSPRTGRIRRALQGHAITCCRRTSAITRAATRLNSPMMMTRAAAYSGKHQLPLDPIENTGKDQRKLLCS